MRNSFKRPQFNNFKIIPTIKLRITKFPEKQTPYKQQKKHTKISLFTSRHKSITHKIPLKKNFSVWFIPMFLFLFQCFTLNQQHKKMVMMMMKKTGIEVAAIIFKLANEAHLLRDLSINWFVSLLKIDLGGFEIEAVNWGNFLISTVGIVRRWMLFWLGKYRKYSWFVQFFSHLFQNHTNVSELFNGQNLKCSASLLKPYKCFWTV